MNKNIILTNNSLFRFAVIDLNGFEIEIKRRYCSRPYQTKEYKSLLKKLNRNEIKAIITQPVKF